MEYIYAALILHSAGKKIDEGGVTSILKAAGITPDAARVKALVAALDGINISEAISKTAFTPITTTAAAPSAAQPASAEKPKETKEEKKKKEKEEEEISGMEGLGALFGNI
ncbi:MAG: 50S ribosomal protein P1 [Methanocellales archaeon]